MIQSPSILPGQRSKASYSLASSYSAAKATLRGYWLFLTSPVFLVFAQLLQLVKKVGGFLESALVQITVFLIKLYVAWKPFLLRLFVRSVSAAWILTIAWFVDKQYSIGFEVAILSACVIYWLVRAD